MSLIKFQCPTCGAPMEDSGHGATIRCHYCSTSVVVPQELIAARPAVVAQAPTSNQGIPTSGNSGSSGVPRQGILYQDNFSDPKSGWEIGKRSGGISTGYENGSYRISLSEDDSAWEAYIDDDFDDFTVDVEVARIKGPKDTEYGVTCRVGDDGGYSFWITGEGYYGICKYYYGETDDDDEEYIVLAEGEASVLQSGSAFNKLSATCAGHTLTMFLNGRKVLEAVDNEFSSGDIAMLASTGESAKGGIDIRFKNLVVRAP